MTTIDSPMTYASYKYSDEAWHLDRIDQRRGPIDHAEFHLDQTGSGVDIYIIDTG